jgi:hypothetical protein
LELIELKRENSFLKNKLKISEKILNKNNIEKFCQRNSIEINLWMLADKDRKIKEKLSTYSLETNNNNNKNNIKKKKKKNQIDKKEKEESIEKDNQINIENIANTEIKSNKINEAKNKKKNIKMDIEDLSLSSNSFNNNNFNFERINNNGMEKKDSINFFNNKFTFEVDEKKIKSNIKKVKK